MAEKPDHLITVSHISTKASKVECRWTFTKTFHTLTICISGEIALPIVPSTALVSDLQKLIRDTICRHLDGFAPDTKQGQSGRRSRR